MLCLGTPSTDHDQKRWVCPQSRPDASLDSYRATLRAGVTASSPLLKPARKGPSKDILGSTMRAFARFASAGFAGVASPGNPPNIHMPRARGVTSISASCILNSNANLEDSCCWKRELLQKEMANCENE